MPRKIHICYNPDSVHSLCLRDNDVESHVEAVIQMFRRGDLSESEIAYGSSLPIDQWRVAIKEGDIEHDDLVLTFEGQELPINSDGRLEYWPPGFGDHMSKLLSRLL